MAQAIDAFEHAFDPVRIVRIEHEDAKSEARALHANPIGIIDMQIDTEGRRVFRDRLDEQQALLQRRLGTHGNERRTAGGRRAGGG